MKASLFLLIIFVLVVLASRVRVVPQAYIVVVERLGTFYKQWGAGVHFLMPVLDKQARKISIKEQVVDFKPQAVITKDNVTMQIDTVIFYQVMDAVKYVYGVEKPMQAIENLTATTLRNIIGDMELDATLTSRDVINTRITDILDHATDRWGIKVLRVELKNILPPAEIRDAMEKQMKAEREKREKILKAQGEREYQVTVAQGEKEDKILRAEADREVQAATAESLVKLNNANPNQAVLTLKSLEAFEKAADGKATKIIIPSEIQGVAGLAAGLKGVLEQNSTERNTEDK